MKCYIYRSRKKEGMYLYLRDQNDFSVVPSDLMTWFVNPVLVFELELSPGRRLARADADAVLKALEKDGFYLQMPPVKTHSA